MEEDIVKQAEDILSSSERVDKTSKTIEFMLENFGDYLFSRGFVEVILPFTLKSDEISRILIKYDGPLEMQYIPSWNVDEGSWRGLVYLINPNFKK